MYNGIINIHKGKGYTSHDVVARLRGIIHQKKIGHTGTLDPDATGVLPVCLGNATKICEYLTDKRKTYETVLCFGYETDTQDAAGTVTERYQGEQPMEELLDFNRISEIVRSFTGDYHQLPPMYSAIKVNGRRLYELAREGKEVARKERLVNIGSIEILKFEYPKMMMRVDCSKGTYIRTLCYDIGRKAGTGACMESLVRTSSGNFTLEESHTLAEVEALAERQEIEKIIMPTENIFMDLASLCTGKEYEKALYNGNPLPYQAAAGIWTEEPEDRARVRVCDSQHRFLAIYEYRKERKMFFPEKMFFSE